MFGDLNFLHAAIDVAGSAKPAATAWVEVAAYSIPGVLLTFFGYKMVRTLRPYYGALVGAAAGTWAAVQLGGGTGVAIGAAVGGSVAGIILMIAMYWAGVFTTGALLGGMGASSVLVLSGYNPDAMTMWQSLTVIGSMIAGGVVTCMFERVLMVMITALFGGLMVMQGMISGNDTMNITSDQNAGIGGLAIAGLMFLVGAFLQFRGADKVDKEAESKDKDKGRKA